MHVILITNRSSLLRKLYTLFQHFYHINLDILLQQAAEAIAESVLSVARAEAIVAVTGESQSTSTPAGELSVVVHALRDAELVMGTTASDLATIVESLTLGENPTSTRHNTNLTSSSIKGLAASRGIKVQLPSEPIDSVEKGDSFRNNQNNVLSSASAEASSSGATASPLVRISGLFVGGEGGTSSGEGEKRKKQLPPSSVHDSGGKKEVSVAGCGGPMSVSVPNLTTSTTSGSEPTTAASTAFAAMARRRTLAGSHAAGSGAAPACTSPSPSPSPAPSPASSSSFFPRGPSSVSSLVRLALSSNFPGQNPLRSTLATNFSTAHSHRRTYMLCVCLSGGAGNNPVL